ncbi:hypothetical protein L596_010524 [Steinernema carpocapsae]|uniref:C-type lectin domain-containing protein n=1 Tax=Steinernema carpocapsae TaxID=34508 RepID=A0A4U5PIR2_STECR|nr:hypothetical protein L596_010524 [Steinernema carpocapsae]
MKQALLTLFTVMTMSMCLKCPPQFHLHYSTKTCIHTIPAYVNFHVAKGLCSSVNAQMVSVHSAAENQFVIQTAQRDIKPFLWIHRKEMVFWFGAYSSYNNNTFAWLDGSQCNFKNWLPGQPDNADGQQSCLGVK